MNKLKLVYYPYELKFLKPFETAKGKVSGKKGLIIKIKNDKGITGTGDICPFPEFGSETYDKALDYIKNFSHSIKLDLTDLENGLKEIFSDIPQFPAVRCGLEQALVSLFSEENNLSLNYLFNRKSRPVISVNGVIDFRDPIASAAMAETLIEEGFTTIKIKVGREKFREDLACVSKISQSAGKDIKLRLDANGKWSLSDAVKHLKELEEFNIEYIEQPVNSLQDFCRLAIRTKIPLAADESIRTEEDASKFINGKCVKFLVLKPMMLGGIFPLMRIYDEAVKNDIGVVVTSSFESGTGRAYAVFAASLIDEDIAHGLATQRYFESKVLPESYAVKNGVIRL